MNPGYIYVVHEGKQLFLAVHLTRTTRTGEVEWDHAVHVGRSLTDIRMVPPVSRSPDIWVSPHHTGIVSRYLTKLDMTDIL